MMKHKVGSNLKENSAICSRSKLSKKPHHMCADSRMWWRANSLVTLICIYLTLQIAANPFGHQLSTAGASPTMGQRAQDVTLDELEALGAGPSGESEPGSGARDAAERMKTLESLLEGLPHLSVGQKHTARFECELNKDAGQAKLVWKKLVRHRELPAATSNTDDIKLISLDQKLITPDKRFKVSRHGAHKWSLSLENVQPEDGNAYYLCQASAVEPPPRATCSRSPGAGSGPQTGCEPRTEVAASTNGSSSSASSSFIGGGRLNVLAPPRIVEQETSDSLVVANEWESLTLRCKVAGEPQSQLMWKREDNRPLESGVQQRFRHESQRKPNHQILSIDSSELSFEPFLRHQAGAYLCIASNGIQPGVSQRINVMAANCRTNGDESAPASSESCDRPVASTTRAPTMAPTSSGAEPSTRRSLWRTGGRQDSAHANLDQAASHKQVAPKQRVQVGAKRRAQTTAGDLLGTDANQFATIAVMIVDDQAATTEQQPHSRNLSRPKVPLSSGNGRTSTTTSCLISWFLCALFSTRYVMMAHSGSHHYQLARAS